MMHRNREFVSGLARMASALLLVAVVVAGSMPAMAQEQKKKKKRRYSDPVPIKRPAATTDTPGKAPTRVPVKPSSAVLKEVDPNAPQPIIAVDGMVHDFGETWIGPKLQHTFKITNSGSKTLQILKVRPSCGCTIAGNYPRKLAPGETGDFPFSINSNKLRGKYEKSITVTSNDPVNSDIRLKLRGNCKRYVNILPAAANFGRIYGGDAQQRVLKVTNNTDNPLELELDVPKDSKFGFELVEVEAGKKYEIHVSLVAGKETGTIREIATLKTNVDAQKSVKVSATATVPKRLDVVPAVITLAKPRPGKSAPDRGSTRIVRFSNYGTTPAKVIEATVDDPKVTVTVTEQKAGKNYDLRLEFPAGYLPPAKGRTLTIKTDDKEQPLLTVALRAPTTRQAANKPRAKRPAEELVGQKAPTFSGTTTEGKPLDNTTLASAITVLDFFAVNCGYCGKQIPRMEKIRQDFEGKGVRFVAVSQTMRNKRYTDEQVKDKIKTLGFRGELVIDSDNKIGPLFKASSFPTMAILGKNGKIAAVNLGNIGDLETRMKGQLDALIAGKPVPTFAAKTPAKSKKRPAEEMVGKPAPSFSLSTIDGKSIASAEFASHPATVLNFVSPNCGYCKKQTPKIEKIRAEYEAKGVRFVNMSMKMGKGVNRTTKEPWTPSEIVDVFKKVGSNLEIAIDEGNAIGRQFKASSFPTMSIVGKDGKIAAVNIGALGDLEKRLRGQLDALIAGKPVPGFASAAPKSRQRPAEGMKGKAAPAFSLSTIGGKTISSADFANHAATVLNFVSPNCGYCKKQVPSVEKVRAEYEAKGVRFVNMSMKMGKGLNRTTKEPWKPNEIVEVFKKAGSGLDVALDIGNAIGTKYKATSFPTMMVVGKDGKVAHVNIGAKKDLVALLKSQLDGLLGVKSDAGEKAEAKTGRPLQIKAVKTLAAPKSGKAD